MAYPCHSHNNFKDRRQESWIELLDVSISFRGGEKWFNVRYDVKPSLGYHIFANYGYLGKT